MSGSDQARRLEELWRGDFGVAYTDRNAAAGASRDAFWAKLLGEFPAKSVLEIGCNLGANLRWIAAVAPGPVAGVDVNAYALGRLRAEAPAARPVLAAARSLPFRSGSFDLVFTMGVLIHQPPDVLVDVMREVVRCAGRFILCGEYFADEPTEIPYRGQAGALFKRDFGALYRETFPGLVECRSGFLGRADGWGDVTWWVFEKR